MVASSRLRFLSFCLFLSLAAGCRAQVPPPSGISSPPEQRRIEVLIRSQFSVPSDYNVRLGTPTRSDFAGYQNLPVTFEHNGKDKLINFLISDDGKTLARLEKFDLTKDPAQSLDVANRPIRGDAAAKVEIVNFDDLQCPYCARMHTELADATLQHYKGLVKIVYKDYPLQEIHPWAMHAAIDANCLASQNPNAYWAYIDYVHAHGQDISGADRDPSKSFSSLDNIADTVAKSNKVDTTTLDACLKKQDASSIDSSVKLGASLGIDGTPQVFVNGERLSPGAQPLPELWAAIDRALKAEGIQPPPNTANTQPATQPATGADKPGQ